MSLHVSAVASKPRNVTSDNVIVRRTAEFPPSLWGDRFLSFDTNSMVYEMDTKTKKQFEELKQEVRRMLVDGYADKPSQKLCLIDTIQHLGVSYHFEAEIDEALQRIHNDSHAYSSCDLYTVALRFRLLRRQGYRVSCDVFNKFMDNYKCEFKEVNDVRGMLELYQATHLRVHGEDVLEKALAFTTTNLKSCVASESISASLAAQVSYALNQPLHKGIPRLEHRYYIDTYQQDPSHNEQLLTFAKLDFNILQKLHLKELSEVTRWWKDVDFKTKLPYARDRLVECYLWIMFTFHEPRYVLGRRMVTKIVSLTSILDDTFDNYGTIEELEIFTKAIMRWDIAALDELPEYMHILYVTILDVYREIEGEMVHEGKSYAVDYAKQAMKDLVGAYMKEARWYNKEYTPTLEEYLSVTSVSSTYPLLTVVAFLGMGEFATKHCFEWFLTFPKMLNASCVVCRLMDDVVSHEFEQKRGHVVSSVQCYMKQHGAKEQDAVDELNKRIIEAWKDINEECLIPTVVPMPLLSISLNFTRIMDVFYKYHDGYTYPEIILKDYVITMFVDPVPI